MPAHRVHLDLAACRRADLFDLTSRNARWYFSIIEKAESENRRRLAVGHEDHVFYERHHVVPRAFGGKPGYVNTVLLTPREHMICHLLLPSMMLSDRHATLMRIAVRRLSLNNRRAIPARLYEAAKRNLGRANSERFGGVPKTAEHNRKNSEAHKGVRNPFYGRKHTPETLEKMRSRPQRTGWNHSPEMKTRLRELALRRTPKPRSAYFLLSPEGRTYLVTNLASFCETKSLLVKRVRDILGGKQNSHQGWTATKPAPLNSTNG